MGWDGDDGIGEDPFGDLTSSDCFGNSIEDVDPFQGNDSFGGDKEWTAFNDNCDSDGDFGTTQDKSTVRHSPSNRLLHKKATSDANRTKQNDRRPPTCRRDRHSNSVGSSSSSRRTAGRPVQHGSTPGRSQSPATTSTARQRDSSSNPLSLNSFMPEDIGDNPFRVGVASPTLASPSKKKVYLADDGFADFGNAFDVMSPLGTESPSSVRKPFSSPVVRGHAKVIHDRHGRAQRLTSKEERSRTRHSESRRNAVKDSMSSSLGDFNDTDDSGKANGLSTYLSEKSGRGKGRRRGAGSGDSVGENSTQSAPAAANHGHYRQRQRNGSGSLGKTTSYDDSYAEPAGSQRRTRAGRRGRLPPVPPAGAQRRTKSDTCESRRQQQFSLDVAALAEHGHLEVVDGKMRLVLDIDAIAR